MAENPVPRARPISWNDDVRWLLERLGGILHDQGRGTGIDSLTRGSPRSEVIHYIRGTHTAVGTTEVTTLQLPATTRSWRLCAFQYNRSDGAAANMQPRLGGAASFTDDSADERLVFASTSVGTPINDQYCSPVHVRTDSDFRLYFKPGFDAGSDNDGIYQFWFVEQVETAESTP